MKYDYIVIGAGPAGYVSAIKAAQLGLKTAIIEVCEDRVGGTCLNEGCIPAKALFGIAKNLKEISEGADLYGIAETKPNIAKFVEKSRSASDTLRKGVLYLFKKKGIDLLLGKAIFDSPGKISIKAPGETDRTVLGKKILIATGSKPYQIPGVPFDGKRILSSSGAIRLKEAPKNILIIGGGAIGTEFASYFNLLGSEVSLLEMKDTLLPEMDKEVSRAFGTLLKKRGVKIITSAIAENICVKENEVQVTIKKSGSEETKVYRKILVAVGRQPNTAEIGLEKIGIELEGKGIIPVDGRMKTAADNVYAAGDVVKGPMLAHVASAEGEIAALDAAGKTFREIDPSMVPNVVYTDIQVARIGLSEDEAREKGQDIAIGKQYFRANGKAVLSGQDDGFVKILADKGTRKILGVHILGPEAGEIIHEFAVAKQAGLTVDDISKTVHAHPTLSEIAVDACNAVFDRPAHG